MNNIWSLVESIPLVPAFGAAVIRSVFFFNGNHFAAAAVRWSQVGGFQLTESVSSSITLNMIQHWSNWLLINTLHQTDWFLIAYCTYIFHLKPERCKHILLFCKTFLVILCSVVQFIFSSAVRTVSTLLELQLHNSSQNVRIWCFSSS